MKDKMNSLARSNASLYAKQHANGGQEELYDRLRRHAYQGKKSGKKLRGFFGSARRVTHAPLVFQFQTKAATRRQVIVTASERRRPQRTGSTNEKSDQRLEKEEGKNQPRIKRLGEIALSGRVLLLGNDV